MIACSSLRELGAGARLGLTAIVLTLAGGYLASVLYVQEHYANQDEDPELSLDDFVASYHGIDRPPRLLTAMEGPHGEEFLPEPGERRAILDWLRSDRISEDYDSLELGLSSPAEILDARCIRCHSRGAAEGGGIGDTLPLEFWDDIEPLAFGMRRDPVPEEILLTSTHAHASSLALISLAAALLLLATRWAGRSRDLLLAVHGLALAADLGAWWLARESAAFVAVILGAGLVYGLSLALALGLVVLDLWLPRRPRA